MQTKRPTARRGAHLQQARTSLEVWRLRTQRSLYSPSALTAASLLPDRVLKTLASASYINTLEDLGATVQWAFTQRHGEEVLAVLRKVDEAETNQRAKAKAAKALSRQLETQARQAEAKRAADEKRDQKRREKENVTPVVRSRRTPNLTGTSVIRFNSTLPTHTPMRAPLGDVQVS